MNNLPASNQIGTVFLDTDLNVQRFTPAATKIINLISTDVGRPVTHIVSNMHYDKLVTDVREVLTTLVPKRIEVQTKSGGWYSMHILPYRTAENMSEGVVVTFVEVTGRKRIETVLGRQRELTNAIMAISPIPLVTLDEKFTIVEANSVFLRDFRFNLEAIRNKKLLDVLQPPGDHAGTKKTPENALKKGASQEIQIALNSRGYSINIKPIKKEPAQPLILVAFNDRPGR
jgi:two-component system, chemotaxis family, CheB/CheR fusion protein